MTDDTEADALERFENEVDELRLLNVDTILYCEDCDAIGWSWTSEDSWILLEDHMDENPDHRPQTMENPHAE